MTIKDTHYTLCSQFLTFYSIAGTRYTLRPVFLVPNVLLNSRDEIYTTHCVPSSLRFSQQQGRDIHYALCSQFLTFNSIARTRYTLRPVFLVPNVLPNSRDEIYTTPCVPNSLCFSQQQGRDIHYILCSQLLMFQSIAGMRYTLHPVFLVTYVLLNSMDEIHTTSCVPSYLCFTQQQGRDTHYTLCSQLLTFYSIARTRYTLHPVFLVPYVLLNSKDEIYTTSCVPSSLCFTQQQGRDIHYTLCSQLLTFYSIARTRYTLHLVFLVTYVLLNSKDEIHTTSCVPSSLRFTQQQGRDIHYILCSQFLMCQSIAGMRYTLHPVFLAPYVLVNSRDEIYTTSCVPSSLCLVNSRNEIYTTSCVPSSLCVSQQQG